MFAGSLTTLTTVICHFTRIATVIANHAVLCLTHMAEVFTRIRSWLVHLATRTGWVLNFHSFFLTTVLLHQEQLTYLLKENLLFWKKNPDPTNTRNVNRKKKMLGKWWVNGILFFPLSSQAKLIISLKGRSETPSLHQSQAEKSHVPWLTGTTDRAQHLGYMKAIV